MSAELTEFDPFGTFKEFFNGSSVLITGGFGFVGSNVAKKLIKLGAKVTVFDLRTSESVESLINYHNLREKIEIVEGNLSDFETVKRVIHQGKFRFIFNFAAYATVIEKAVESPYDTVLANTLGWVNVMESARTAPFKPDVVFLSSTDKVYGEMDGHAYQEDSTPLRGIGVYDAAKLAADVLGKTYSEVFGLPTVVLRMCNLFGPGDFNTGYRLIPKAMRNLFAGKDPVGPELYFDAIDHRRDYLYIDDAVRAILLLSMHPACRGDVFNLRAAEYTTTPHLLRTLVLAAAEIVRESDPQRADQIVHNGIVVKVRESETKVVTIKNQHLDGNKITLATGFIPEIEFKEGLRRTIKAYRTFYQGLQEA
ncbi:MAG: hypothetical protein RL173_3264 [Fibrobacterota bacterium]|jgi:nucleoside-diphosphate-sugar epimerase